MNRPEIFKFDEGVCSVCDAGFLNEHLDEQGRCKLCASKGYAPGTEQEQEYVKSAEQKRAELKELVKDLMKEIQEEKEAEKKQKAFAPKPCKKCGEEFQPRAAAHVICQSCQDEDRAKS